MTDDLTKTTSPGEPSRPRPITATRLVVVVSPDKSVEGRLHVLGDESVTIGRTGHTEGPLSLDDAQLSRTHALIKPDPSTEGWRLVDCKSRNGTFVNGDLITEHPLSDGDVLRIGSSVLIFQGVAIQTGESLTGPRDPLWGPSIAMQRIRAEILAVASQSISVLILGETGVGKELVAESLHHWGDCEGPFVPVNCGALPKDLVESELFGHVAGAFSGARSDKEGLFVSANRGTIFLDEIGEMPMNLQPKLLRVLADGMVRPVGSTRTIPVNVRVVAATNRDPSEAIAEGTLRADLYARLSGWTISIPPLHARPDDIIPLAKRFLADNQWPGKVGADAAEALLLYPWPYNVRELQQAMHGAVIRAASQDTLHLVHLPAKVCTLSEGPHERRADTLDETPLSVHVASDIEPTTDDLRLALQHHKGNIAQVAEFFGKDRRQIYRWAEKLGVDMDAFRTDD